MRENIKISGLPFKNVFVMQQKKCQSNNFTAASDADVEFILPHQMQVWLTNTVTEE